MFKKGVSSVSICCCFVTISPGALKAKRQISAFDNYRAMGKKVCSSCGICIFTSIVLFLTHNGIAENIQCDIFCAL